MTDEGAPIWTPRPYIHSTSFIQPVKRINGETDYIIAAPPNKFAWHMEFNIGVECPFDFAYYPFDSHSCQVKFQSHSYEDSVVRYTSGNLTDSSLEIQPALKYHVAYDLMTDKEDLQIITDDASFSTCGFYIYIDRKRVPAVLSVFIPSFLIVLITFCR